LNSHNDYDIQLINLPAFTSLSPSLALASLGTYLYERGYRVHVKDYSFEFFKKEFNNLKISNKFDFEIPSFFIFGISNWLTFSEYLFPDDFIPNNVLKSLCPVSNDLYKDVYQELKNQKKSIQNVIDKYVKEITSVSANNIGFSINIGNGAASLYAAKKIKEIFPEKRIIFGGSETRFTYRPKFYLSFPFVDVVIHHFQGEVPLLDLITPNKPLELSRGIGFLKNDDPFFTPPPALIDVNDLPIPNYDIIETKEKFDVINIFFTRGCNSNCLFCNEKSFLPHFLTKSPQKVINEITYYQDQGFEKFETIDQSFNNSPEILNEIIERITENNIKIEWGGNAECYKMTEKLLKKTVKSGLTHCYYGIESGSKDILNLMKKPLNLDHAIKLLRLGNEHGLEQFVYIIVGFPGETNDDFEKTRAFLMNNQEFIKGSIISIYTLLNGSEMFNNGLIKPIQLQPKILNAFTYESKDGITHEIRKERYLNLKKVYLNRRIK